MRLSLAAACAAVAGAVATVELTAFSLSAESALPASLRDGAALTAPGFSPSGAAWTPVTVPCTVVGCLLQAGVIPADVFRGDNIAQINATYNFDDAYWYWAAFSLEGAAGGAFASLELQGVSYRAEVWVNGAKIAGNDTVRGMYNIVELDVSGAVVRGGPGGANHLAVRLTRQHNLVFGPGAAATVDLGGSFVDWSYADPPDFNLGLWRKVLVHTHGAATLRSAAVATELPPPSQPSAAAAPGAPPLAFAYANLTVLVEARNYDGAPFAGTLSGAVLPPGGGGAAPLCTFAVPVALVAGAAASLAVNASAAPCLRLAAPQLWWPWQMQGGGGAPALHVLNLTLTAAGGAASDALPAARFGVRTAASALTAAGQRQFFFNTLPILVRGGGWSPDLFQRVDPVRLDRQLAMARDLGLNAIRLEGKMEPDEFFDALDELGMLALPGWCCCDSWQRWPAWGAEQRAVAAASMRSQALRLRGHAGMLGFLVSSDELPPADVEALYLDELAAASWPRFAANVSAASAAASKISGPTGVKMSGPYSWVPPHYWLADSGGKGVGGGWGFLTEGGPGESPMTAESLRATLDASAAAWPPAPTTAWGKAGNPAGNFAELTRFNAPLAARYGATAGAGDAALSDYLAKAAAASLEGHKAFIEGYSRLKTPYGNATGLVQWMLNNDAPSNIWHFWHHDLTHGSAGAAAKQALAPLHIGYDHRTRAAFVVNSLYARAPAAPTTAAVRAFDLAGATLFAASAPLAAGAVAADGVLELPASLTPPAPAATHFLRLTLTDDASGAVVDANTLWLPAVQDVIDWGKSTWYNTPCSSFANMSDLFSVLGAPARADVTVTAAFAPLAAGDIASAGARWLAGRDGGAGPWTRASVDVANAGARPAFLVRLRLQPEGGAPPDQPDPAPVFWQDNFIVLLPGENKSITAEFPNAVLGGLRPQIAWDFGGGGR